MDEIMTRQIIEFYAIAIPGADYDERYVIGIGKDQIEAINAAILVLSHKNIYLTPNQILDLQEGKTVVFSRLDLEIRLI